MSLQYIGIAKFKNILCRKCERYEQDRVSLQAIYSHSGSVCGVIRSVFNTLFEYIIS